MFQNNRVLHEQSVAIIHISINILLAEVAIFLKRGFCLFCIVKLTINLISLFQGMQSRGIFANCIINTSGKLKALNYVSLLKSRANLLNVSSRTVGNVRLLIMFLSCNVPIYKVWHEQAVAINSATMNFLLAEVTTFLK